MKGADTSFDAAVIGAGIVGVTAALELAVAGARVILLEGRRVGSGASGSNTGKVSALAGLIYADLERRFGEETASAYAMANQAGLNGIAENAERYSIECDLRRKTNFIYSEQPAGRVTIAREAEAANRAGLSTTLHEEIEELPFEVAAAVGLADQLEIHPLRYLHGLAVAAAGAGVTIREHAQVLGVRHGAPCRIRLRSGEELRAGRVVLATHLPILDRGLFFARTHPERSYVVLARLDREPVPQGMYLSDESSAHSLRSVPTANGERLMVGGESHKTGQSDSRERFEALEAWTKERFRVDAIEHRWAAQDHLSHDQLPLVGPISPFASRILVATGLRKWGLAMGAAAGGMLAGTVLGRPDPLAQNFTTQRVEARRGLGSFIRENGDDGLRFAAGRFAGRRRSADSLEPGQGAVVSSGREQHAAYRKEDGSLCVHSARCTHLGCIVRFNAAERSWDCPCHASRFDAVDGSVLEGPAVKPLPRVDI